MFVGRPCLAVSRDLTVCFSILVVFNLFVYVLFYMNVVMSLLIESYSKS